MRGKCSTRCSTIVLTHSVRLPNQNVDAILISKRYKIIRVVSILLEELKLALGQRTPGAPGGEQPLQITRSQPAVREADVLEPE
jgi:hypothetical protein